MFVMNDFEDKNFHVLIVFHNRSLMAPWWLAAVQVINPALSM